MIVYSVKYKSVLFKAKQTVFFSFYDDAARWAEIYNGKVSCIVVHQEWSAA